MKKLRIQVIVQVEHEVEDKREDKVEVEHVDFLFLNRAFESQATSKFFITSLFLKICAQ